MQAHDTIRLYKGLPGGRQVLLPALGRVDVPDAGGDATVRHHGEEEADQQQTSPEGVPPTCASPCQVSQSRGRV